MTLSPRVPQEVSINYSTGRAGCFSRVFVRGAFSLTTSPSPWHAVSHVQIYCQRATRSHSLESHFFIGIPGPPVPVISGDMLADLE